MYTLDVVEVLVHHKAKLQTSNPNAGDHPKSLTNQVLYIA